MSEKRKKSKFYSQYHQKKARRFTLDVGNRGFLCSCNNREKECIREAYNLLNKYHDLSTKPPAGEPEEAINVTEGEAGAANSKDKHYIEDELKAELLDMKHDAGKAPKFQVIESGAKNFLFIRTTIPDPIGLVKAIFEDIEKTKTAQTRHLLRLIPVEITCKAYVDEIKTHIGPLLDPHFLAPNHSTFSVVYNHRNNNTLSKDDVIDEIAKMVVEKNMENKVKLNEPDISVVVEVIKGFAFLSVIPNYVKYKKYNLHLFCEQDESAAGDNDCN